MFYTCAPHAPAADHGHHAAVNRRGKRLTVDIHCHVHVPSADEMLKASGAVGGDVGRVFSNDLTNRINVKQNIDRMPQLSQIDIRLADMDAQGIDIQAISPSPFHYNYWVDTGIARDITRHVNDRIGEIAAKHPDRFAPMCIVPLQNCNEAVAELERCHKQHGMRGVEISTNVNGKELTRCGLDKFFARVEALDMMVFVHPAGTSEGNRMRDHYFTNLIGHPLESALAVGHLIFDGYLERFPGLKVCIAHGGGYAPAYWGRFDHPYPTREDVHGKLPHPPSHYLKKLHFDTVVFTELQLRHLIESWGADRILLGTDYPYDMAETDPVGHVESVKGLSEPDRALVCGANAARLMGIKVPARG